MMPNDKAAVVEESQEPRGAHEDVHVTVDYLPATKPFGRAYPAMTMVETVRTDAMGFFSVRDRQERDTYRYFLELSGNRLTDTQQTLEQLLGPHRRGAHFNLVEQITPGMIRR
jgi:hypothetical protein